MCKTADVMQFTKLCLAMDQIQNPERKLEWVKCMAEASVADVLEVKIPMQAGDNIPKASLEINVRKLESLQSAGQRIALFTRLAEESGLESILNPDSDMSLSDPPSPQLRFPFKDTHELPFKIAPE